MNSAAANDVTVRSLTYEFLAKHKGYIVLYALSLLMNPVKELALPHLFGRIVKKMQAGENVMTLFVWVIVLWVSVQGVFAFIDWQDVYYYPAMMEFLREKVTTHVLDTHRENYDDLKTFETIAKQAKLPMLIYGFLDMWKRTFIPQAVLFAFAICYIAMHDSKAGIVLALVVATTVAIVMLSPKKCERVSQGKDMSFNALNEETEDVLRNMMAVLNAVNEDRERQNLSRFHDGYSHMCRETMLCVISMQARMLPLQVLFMAFMVWRCYRIGQTDVGTGVAMMLIVLSLSSGLTRVFNETRDLIVKWGMVKESMTVFDGNTPSKDNPCADLKLSPDGLAAAAASDSADAPQIMLDGVSFIYKNSLQPVIDNVTLAVPEHQRVLIMGRIGSGKSTLLKLIMRYKRPSTGEVYLRGVPYCAIRASNVRKRIGYVPQLPMLFNRSIYDNIVYGSEDKSTATVERVEALIRELGLESMFDNLEHGLMSLAGKNGSRLSGGQRQVVWILRVLLQEPEILLLDEPTASIDAATKDIIYSLLERIMTDRTVIMVTHDSYLLQHCDRVLELGERGAIMYDGPPPQQVREAKGQLQQMLMSVV